MKMTKSLDFSRYLCAMLLALTLLHTFAAHGFATFGWLGVNYHGIITKTAAQSVNLSVTATEDIVENNKKQDVDETEVSLTPPFLRPRPNLYQGAHHFDRNANLNRTDRESFVAGLVYLNQEKTKAIDALNNGNRSEATKALGRATHVLQDFYSHSNYVDLSPIRKKQIDAALANPGETATDINKLDSFFNPPNIVLVLTGYESVQGGDPLNDAYGHDKFSKDGKDLQGRETPESAKIVGDKTKHQIALLAATKATSQLFLDVKGASVSGWSLLTDNIVVRLQKHGNSGPRIR